MKKFYENGVLRLPTGFGKLVGKAISNGLVARYIFDDPPSETSKARTDIAFPEISSVPLFGIQLVAISYSTPSSDGGLILVEVLPGRFSGSKAKTELEEWSIETMGRDEVADADALEADGMYGGYTTQSVRDNVTWGIVSLTVPTLSASLHRSVGAPFVEVPITIAPRPKP